MQNFDLVSSRGNHRIYKDKTNDGSLSFDEFLKKLWGTDTLDDLHLVSKDYAEIPIEELSKIDSELHKLFYSEIKKSNKFLSSLYLPLVKKIHQQFFREHETILYQTYPNLRIQYPNGTAIPKHKDSDELSKHPIGENNFILPITRMYNTCSMYIESKPDSEDFEPVNIDNGHLLWFDGNKCTHYNETNQENITRVSLDFRIITPKHYNQYIECRDLSVAEKNDRDILRHRDPSLMVVGGYYQMMHKKDHDDVEYIFRFSKPSEMIPQHRPTFTDNEANACYEYMKDDNFVTEHRVTQALEQRLAQYIGSRHCVMTTSGTSAIVLALMACELPKGADIIVPNYTMIATVNAISHLGYNPIIVDVSPLTFTLDVAVVRKAVTPNTRAVIHVSLNNRYVELDKLVDYCNQSDYVLIEDSAQSLGVRVSTHDGKHLGTFGRIGCFSLSTPKIISTGQGGFCVTDDDVIARRLSMIKNFGRRESGKDDFEIFGLNMKFTDLQATIGLEQMKTIDWRTKRMREMYNLYYRELCGVHSDLRILEPLDDAWLPWFVDVYTSRRDDLYEYLKRHKVQTRVVYGEVNKTPMYSDGVSHPTTEYVSAHGLFLPSYLTLSDECIIYVCSIIRLFFE